MSPAKKYLPNYSVEDYQQWEGDWELYDGIPVAMPPAPAFRHQDTGTRILSSFFGQLENKNCGHCRVVYEIDWVIDQNTVVRPDVLIVCGDKIENQLKYAPTLIVEILSPSTAERDRTVKYELYQQHGLEHFLLADPETKSLEAFRNNEGQFQSVSAGPEYSFDLGHGCHVALASKSIFAAD